jgi:hypothetical protein
MTFAIIDPQPSHKSLPRASKISPWMPEIYAHRLPPVLPNATLIFHYPLVSVAIDRFAQRRPFVPFANAFDPFDDPGPWGQPA